MEELAAYAESTGHNRYIQISESQLLYLRRIDYHTGYKLVGIQATIDGILPAGDGFSQSDIFLLQLDEGAMVWHGDESVWPDITQTVFSSAGPILSVYQDSATPLAGIRQIYTSDGYEVAFLMPQGEMYSALSVLHVTCIICCIVLVLLGAVMAFLFVRAQYRPIRRVADLVLSRAHETAQDDVFHAIENQVHTYLRELEQKEDQLRTAKEWDRQHVLQHLITGWGGNYDSDTLRRLDISLAESHYALVCTQQPGQLSKEAYSVATQATIGAVQQRLANFGLMHTIRFPRETMFLLDSRFADAKALKDLLSTLADTLTITLQSAVNIGISRPQPGAPGLQLAAREAEAALYAAVRQQQPVVLFEELTEKNNVDRLFFNRLATIYDLTQSGSYQAALDLCEELSQQPGLGTLQAIALAINSAASAVRLESPEQELALHKLLELPSVLNSPEDLQEYAGRIFGQLAVSTTPSFSEQDAQILDYLQQCYTDPQLSVSEIARQLSVSQSTLSRITMRTVGLTPLDYIQHLRMEQAKELLGSGLSVTEVAQRVGCTNDAALRRIFKKFENSTPAHYMNS